MKKNMKLLPFFFLALLTIGCSQITKVTDAITNPTIREKYERSLRRDPSVFHLWAESYQSAKENGLEVPLPYGEKGTFIPFKYAVHSYSVPLQEGEVLVVDLSRELSTDEVFIDVLESSPAGLRPAESNNNGEDQVSVAAEASSVYKVIIQPSNTASGDFLVSINKRPLYGFPVAGKGNSAIQSFWAAPRDGGKRNHEGIDIFAKRGTPVVAVSDGTVTYTGDRGLGGKQVWQRTGIFGNSIYYAHLDQIAAVSGDRVTTGDTIGFVGSTGNAKGGVPHLHFGIYGPRGAVDPLPFVYQTITGKASDYKKTFESPVLRITSAQANLRGGPSPNSLLIGQLKKNDVVTLLGQSKEWLHILTAARQNAFIHKTLVKPV